MKAAEGRNTLYIVSFASGDAESSKNTRGKSREKHDEKIHKAHERRRQIYHVPGGTNSLLVPSNKTTPFKYKHRRSVSAHRNVNRESRADRDAEGGQQWSCESNLHTESVEPSPRPEIPPRMRTPWLPNSVSFMYLFIASVAKSLCGVVDLLELAIVQTLAVSCTLLWWWNLQQSVVYRLLFAVVCSFVPTPTAGADCLTDSLHHSSSDAQTACAATMQTVEPNNAQCLFFPHRQTGRAD